MKILERARDIILNPRVTWQAVKEETVELKQLFVNYAAPLALIPVVSSLIGMTIIGIRMPAGSVIRAPFIGALFGGLVGYILHLAGLLVGGWLVKTLAPFFSSKPDFNSAMKVVVYSMTPVWLAGVFSLIPGLGILSLLGLYGIYLLVLGLPVVMETPSEKVALYTISILAVGLVISLVLSGIIVGTIYGPMYMRMMAM
jgi:hypothetical protein